MTTSPDELAAESDRPQSTVQATPGLLGASRAGLTVIANWIVPAVCIACRAALSQHDALCARCWSGIAFIRQPLCDRLGLPLPFGGGDGEPIVSAAAAADPPSYARARAVAVFERDGVLQRLVHGFKYQDRHDARRLFGRWLVDAGRELFPGTDLIVPVPLSRRRLLWRRYNQAALLAHELARATGLVWDPSVFVRSRATAQQVGLTREQRRLNVRNAFTVPARHRQAVAGRNILLIDDVITTGATVEAAARALMAAGVRRVDVLALGLVTDPRAVTL
jgi:ComF family protein